MQRAILLVLDSFGIGAAADAALFGDSGADTFGHIWQYCASQRATGVLQIPNLARLGLLHAAEQSRQQAFHPNPYQDVRLTAAYGYAVEQSKGKDTPSGHWEMAGLPVLFDWGYFPAQEESFPQSLLADLVQQAQLPGILGNQHASGTVIIEQLGRAHLQTGKPIVYTSADSVLQIAAHEEQFGLQRLYDVCKTARRLVDNYKIGRVIARPFVGTPGQFKRTANRRDYATPPHADTLLDKICQAQGQVFAIGKIADIFAHRGISKTIKAASDDALFSATLDALQTAGERSLIFSNFVDFDSVYGHRRDVGGYAAALEAFDRRLPELTAVLQAGDMVIVTADHGCDPSMPGSDHTREHVPVLVYGPKVTAVNLGQRASFADIGQSIAQHLGLQALAFGQSFLSMCQYEK